jgi:hypothetical protein
MKGIVVLGVVEEEGADRMKNFAVRAVRSRSTARGLVPDTCGRGPLVLRLLNGAFVHLRIVVFEL